MTPQQLIDAVYRWRWAEVNADAVLLNEREGDPDEAQKLLEERTTLLRIAADQYFKGPKDLTEEPF